MPTNEQQLAALRDPSMALAWWLAHMLDEPEFSQEFQRAAVAWLRALPPEWWNQQQHRSETPPCVW